VLLGRWVIAAPRSPLAPVTMMFFQRRAWECFFEWDENKVKPSGAGRGGRRDHRKPAQIDIACDEIRGNLQERLQVRSQHVGLQTLGGAPVFVDEPDVAIVD
jgi:hypothetical protein